MRTPGRITYRCQNCSDKWSQFEWKHHFIFPTQLLFEREKGTHIIPCELGTNCPYPSVDYIHRLYTATCKEPKTYYYCFLHTPEERTNEKRTPTSREENNDMIARQKFINDRDRDEDTNTRSKKRLKFSDSDYHTPE
jgi:hypothetical protein